MVTENKNICTELSPEVVYERIKPLVRGIKGRFLDLGAGMGKTTTMISSVNKKVLGYALDLYPEHFRANGRCRRGDLNRTIPFKDEYFDTIISLEVIEHIENPRHFFRECYRLLKPGGELILSTPNNSCLTARLSFFFRGSFPFFSDQLYPMHITALTKRDLILISRETKFEKSTILYTDSGRMPKLNINWQDIFPGLRGELFSDNIIFHCAKTQKAKI